jgi:hypothetical protein
MMRRGIGRVGRPSLIGTAARTAVVVGTASAVSGKVANSQQEKAQNAAEAQAVEQQQQQAANDAQVQAEVAAQMAAQAPAAAPAAGGLTEDSIAQLQQLAQLKDQGILTEEEFAAQKAKILGM